MFRNYIRNEAYIKNKNVSNTGCLFAQNFDARLAGIVI